MLRNLTRILARFRHPISLPEDVESALGVPLSNFLSFEQVVTTLKKPSCLPTKLLRYMPRKDAEKSFQTACNTHCCQKESFLNLSIFTYDFNGKSISFELRFDDQAKLRRIYLNHSGNIEEQELHLLTVDDPHNATTQRKIP